MPLKLMYITPNPEVATIAQKYGVDRIFIDMEYIGKQLRQGGMDTVQSHHTVEDIRAVRNVLTSSELLVRCNPIHEKSEEEINEVVTAGADIIMLPFFKTVGEVKAFLGYVRGRCRTMLLLETREAAECLDEILQIKGIDEIHIGLNDLHLSYGMHFMFEPLANGMVEKLCDRIREDGIPYGFGGIARLGTGPLPAERIVTEHYRLHSSGVILSRSFCNEKQVKDLSEIERIFAENTDKLRTFEKELLNITAEEFESNRIEVQKCVEKIVTSLKETR